MLAGKPGVVKPYAAVFSAHAVRTTLVSGGDHFRLELSYTVEMGPDGIRIAPALVVGRPHDGSDAGRGEKNGFVVPLVYFQARIRL